MEDTKKKIAAMAAVLFYLKREEEVSQYGLPESRSALSVQEGFWSYSGRQSQMMLRSMAQMRLFPSWKS